MNSDASSERILITGIGVISPLGNSIEAFAKALAEGKSGIGPLRGEQMECLPLEAGGQAWDFDGKIDGFGELPHDKKKNIRKGLKVMCREIQMGVAAAQRAFARRWA